MAQRLRILLIDNDLRDRSCVIDELPREFPEVRIDAVESLEPHRAALKAGAYDLVITEYQLERTDGLAVLEAVKNEAPNCPVIMYTDTGSEAVAVEGMKRGLADYVAKSTSNIAPLATAVAQVVKVKASPEMGRFRDAYLHVPVGLFRITPEGATLDANPAFARILGYNQLDGLQPVDLGEMYAEAADRKRWRELLRLNGGAIDVEAPVRRQDQELIWVLTSVHAVRGDGNQILYYEGSLQDITAHKHAEAVLRGSEQEIQRHAELLNLLHQIDQSILAAQSTEAIVKATLSNISQLVPYQQGSIALFEAEFREVRVFATYGQPRSHLGTGTLMEPETFGNIARLENGEPLLVQDVDEISEAAPWVERLRRDGVRSFIKVPLMADERLIGALNLESNNPHAFESHHLAFAHEVAASLAVAIRQAQLLEQVQRLAVTDELTALYNRRQFFDLGKREFERAHRYGRPLSAIMLDIDLFKQVNDQFGHAIGDQALRAVAQRCRGTIRELDILGRYGGDEFVLLLPETGIRDARAVAERLRRNIGITPILSPRGPVHITVSLGAATLSAETQNLEALIDLADRAMYAAKQRGRNQVATK